MYLQMKPFVEMYSVDPDNIYDDVSRMNRGFIVWESETLIWWPFILWTGSTKRFLTLLLTLGKQGVYHANFRFGKGFNGEPAMWIGAIQGYKDGLDNAKTVTKKMFGYRPKTLLCSYYAMCGPL